MKFKLLLSMLAISFISFSSFAGLSTNLCVKAAGYTAPFWGSSTYQLRISDGINNYVYTGTSAETLANMKVWLSIALTAKSQGKQISIYHDDGVFNILSVGIEDANCP